MSLGFLLVHYEVYLIKSVYNTDSVEAALLIPPINLLVRVHLEAVRVSSVPCSIACSAEERFIPGVYRWAAVSPRRMANLTRRMVDSSTKKAGE